MRGRAPARSRQQLSCRAFFSGRDPGDAIASTSAFAIFYPIDVAIQPAKSHQPIHRAFLNDIMSAPQTIVGVPVHVFRLIRKFFKHVRAPSQLQADFPCLS
jgi:hypothetical protein